jgi:hypothetical protein
MTTPGKMKVRKSRPLERGITDPSPVPSTNR